jgi:hypothetical protein
MLKNKFMAPGFGWIVGHSPQYGNVLSYSTLFTWLLVVRLATAHNIVHSTGSCRQTCRLLARQLPYRLLRALMHVMIDVQSSISKSALICFNYSQRDWHSWATLMKVKNEFLRFCTLLRIVHRSGYGKTNGWEIQHCENNILVYITQHKWDTVVEVFSTSPLNISRRRDLTGCKLTAWNNLVPRLANIMLSQEPDEFRWNLHPNGQFSVKLNLITWQWFIVISPT